jgi:hypothetical protein
VGAQPRVEAARFADKDTESEVESPMLGCRGPFALMVAGLCVGAVWAVVSVAEAFMH